MNTNVLRAVFKRNFVSYFASPTGYVFICVFVLLSGVAAFWPNEFFNANLANLDQLNWWFPFIMLVFIPAITMGIWADERRQGTDELLLTIPASDFEIVLGKYLAAVAIYTVALCFSLLCNYVVLAWLGDPDLGLFLGTNAGYWFVGTAMLAMGMVASFLTANITVAYIFGVILNLPLVFAVYADAIAPPSVAIAVKQWSISQQFRDFGRGVIGLSGIAYFATIFAVMLYLSMVLIGRRHWIRGGNWLALGAHYLVRALALAVIVAGITALLRQHDARLDVTSERLSSLSPKTIELLSELKLDRPVQVEAFISPTVPESYVQTRLNLRSMLRELEARGGGKVNVRVNDTERFSEEAARAEKRYGITPKEVFTQQRGAVSRDSIFLHVAMSSGLQKVPAVFIDRGIPVEYELVRSLCTVAKQKRKRVGVLQTDAQLYGSFNMQTMSSSGNWPIIEELEKQYEVVKVDPAQPINDKYDVLLAVQPSSLGPQEMDNFVAAVRSGQPTAIFEDPFPAYAPGVPPTTAPRQAPGGMNPMMMMQRQPPPPKGDVRKLWNLLGVDFTDDQVVWQSYNPYPKLNDLPPEFVFIDKGAGAAKGLFEPFDPNDPASAGLQHVLFPFPGAISKLNASDLEFHPLARTGERTGTVRFSDLMQMTPFGPRGELNPARHQIPYNKEYVLAAHIRGKVKPDAQLAGDEGKKNETKGDAKPEAKEAKPEAKPQAKPEAKPEAKAEPKPEPKAEPKPEPKAEPKPEPKAEPKPEPKPESKPEPKPEPKEEPKAELKPEPKAEPEAKPEPKPELKPEIAVEAKPEKTEAKPEKKPEERKPTEINVILVADIDVLSQVFFRLRAEQGDNPEGFINFDFDNVTFVLNVLDELAGDRSFVQIRNRRPKHRTLTGIEKLTEAARREASAQRESFNKEFEEEKQKLQKALDEKVDAMKKRKDASTQDMLNEVALALQDGQRRLESKTEQLREERDRKGNRIETDLTLEVNKVRNYAKWCAVALPPIPWLFLAVAVLIVRRRGEREGVARSRLK